MSNFNMHSIKRAARKEAWYSDSMNPFRKNSGRSHTWTPDGADRDVEASAGQREDLSLSAIATEPGQNTHFDDSRTTASKREEAEALSASRPSDPDSEATIVDRKPSRPPSHEEQARHRFVSLFHKKKDNQDHVGDVDEQPEKKKKSKMLGKDLKHEPFTLRNQLQNTIFNSWINILIIAAPVGIILNYVGVAPTAIFVVNFIAIIPLAALLSFATEEIALHVGESLGGLLNASFGNAVEMIVGIIALAHGQVVVVQTSLIGSILSNLLLVLGMCFFCGGLRRPEQFFNETVAQTAASLLALAVGSVIIPTCFDQFSTTTQAPIAAISRGTSVILLVVYAGYLYFQLHTHTAMYNEESKKVAMKPRKKDLPEGAMAKGLAKVGAVSAGPGRAQLSERQQDDELVRNNESIPEDDDEPEEPRLHIYVAWATLAGATAIIGLCAEFMVDSINAITESGAISVEFVGLILLPIVGNAAEHATAVTVACRDKLDLSLGVAVGSSLQVSLLLIPLMVIIGWCMGNDNMTLSFDGFQVAALFIAVLLVNYLISDGKSHWLEGLLLMCLYVIIALCAWFYPPPAGLGV